MGNIAIKNMLKILAICAAASLTVWIIWMLIAGSVNSFRESVSTGVVSSTQVQVDDMRKELRTAEKYVHKFKAKALDASLIPELLNELETKVPSAAVEVSGISEDESTGILSVWLTFECALTECISIAKQETELDFLTGVESLTMSELEGGNWSTSMKINIPLLPENI